MEEDFLNFEQLQNKFEKKKVNTFLVYQKGELTTEYYKTIDCANDLFKINSITKSIVSILIGIAIDKGFINNIHTQITTWIPNVPEKKEGINAVSFINDDNRRRLARVRKWGCFPK